MEAPTATPTGSLRRIGGVAGRTRKAKRKRGKRCGALFSSCFVFVFVSCCCMSCSFFACVRVFLFLFRAVVCLVCFFACVRAFLFCIVLCVLFVFCLLQCFFLFHVVSWYFPACFSFFMGIFFLCLSANLSSPACDTE